MSHRLVVELDGDTVDVRIECLSKDPERECGSWVEAGPFEPGVCACTDPECGCREDDHGDCGEFGVYIENVGYTCRAKRTGLCWFVEQVAEVGWQETVNLTAGRLVLPIGKLTGTVDDPIEFDVVGVPTWEPRP